jgi:probable HAF family extracellular repeat protein
MNRASNRIAGVLAVAIAFYGQSSAQSGWIYDLGVLPGGYESGAGAVSADGSVVVGASFPVPTYTRASRWSLSEGLVSLGTLTGAEAESSASGVSADGSVIVGTARDRPPGADVGSNVAYRITAADGMQSLGAPIDRASYAHGVSADGTVVVGTSGAIAFRWTAASGIQPLNVFGGTRPSDALAASADGSVIVGGGNINDTHQRAFRWTTQYGSQDLGTLGGFSVATATNSDGTVVVGASRLPDSDQAIGRNHAFIWTNATGMQDLGVVSGFDDSEARGVSGDGTLVVGSLGKASGRGSSFIWSPSSGMMDLAVYLPSIGIGITDWETLNAAAISSDGKAIVGMGTKSAGGERGFLINLGNTPPPPPPSGVPEIDPVNGGAIV